MLHFRMDMPLYLMAFYGSIMIVIVLILRSFLKNYLPKFVFPMMWGLVLVRLLVPFSLSSPISAPVPEWQIAPIENTAVYSRDILLENTDATATVASENQAYTYSTGLDGFAINWGLVISIIFVLGAAATASFLFLQKKQYSEKLKNSLLVEHNQTINSILREMGMGHILVFTNDEIASPLVCGIIHPCIYLPAAMDFRQTTLLRHILAHETMHIKHKDNLLKAFLILVLCMHWYNPLVWIMSKCLSSDLEAACDGAVLRQIDEDERKSYAVSLLSMAIGGNHSSLLYSAFSKTEVERRIRSILDYKKATAMVLSLSVLFLLTTTVAFATAGQAPFSKHLSSYCGSTSSRWGVKATLTRDISLGENAGKRADNTILEVLQTDSSNDPDVIAAQVKAALSKEFKVEKGAFQLVVNLCLMEDEITQEYAKIGLKKGSDGSYSYRGKTIRTYADKMLGSYQTREKGAVDISVQRNHSGQITSILVFREGDAEFDRRTREIKQNQSYYTTFDESEANSQGVEQVTTVESDRGTRYFYEH